MAKISEIVNDLTGQLNQMGSGSGARTRSDPYMQASMMAGASGVGVGMGQMMKPAGPVSPCPASSMASASGASPPIPPAQMAMAPQMPSQSSMPPPMDGTASVQQGMMAQAAQRVALEGSVMRPPYTQPYGQGAFALSPGFQGAPVGALQPPVYSSMDSCGLSGPQLRASPASQMQALQQQRMAQLQAQQQAVQAQALAAQAGQACLVSEKAKKKDKKPKKSLKSVLSEASGSKSLWWVWLILVIVLLVLVVVGFAYVVKNHKQLESLSSALGRPVGV